VRALCAFHFCRRKGTTLNRCGEGTPRAPFHMVVYLAGTRCAWRRKDGVLEDLGSVLLVATRGVAAGQNKYIRHVSHRSILLVANGFGSLDGPNSVADFTNASNEV
jgi:hypothetical protein